MYAVHVQLFLFKTKKHEKTFKLFSAFAFILSALWLISSCTKGGKACKDVECLNGGFCQDGSCFCPDGFGGSDCGTVVSGAEAPVLVSGNALGWDDGEDHSHVPVHVDDYSFAGAGAPGTAVDLGSYFPPIQPQGAAPTCVDWAVAYYGFTAMKAIDFGIDPTQAPNQASAKALWCATPSNRRGLISEALEVMLHEGVADMALVPNDISSWNKDAYEFNNCNSQGSIPLAWSAEAEQHRITHYRKLDNTVEAIKSQLSQHHPVVFSAIIDSFFAYSRGQNTNGVYTTLGGPRLGGHAMTIQGYDDSKNAFRVRNSWGNTWNGDGTIWVDYNLMVSPSFTNEGFFVMSNDGHNMDVWMDQTSGGMDLVPWIHYDHGVPGSANRTGAIDIYNIGDAPVPSSENYHTYLMYVNAYDASDFGILFDYEVTDTIPVNNPYCPSNSRCLINIDLPASPGFGAANYSIGYAAALHFHYIGADTISGLSHNYTMPNISGQYYILLFTDPLNEVAEKNESNNVFYLGGHLPKTFNNGYSAKPVGRQHQATSYKNGLESFKNPLEPTKRNLEKMDFRTAVTHETLNAYSIGELYQTMKNAAASGVWDRKVAEYETRTKR